MHEHEKGSGPPLLNLNVKEILNSLSRRFLSWSYENGIIAAAFSP